MKNVYLIRCKYCILLFIVFVVSPTLTTAQKVEYGNIEKIAINAFSLNSGTNKKSLVIKQVIPVSTNNEISFYIFNFEPQGHIVIAAEKFANPVLGYGLTSNIDFSNIPPGLNCLLGNFNNEISQARTKKVKAEKDTEEKWDYYLNSDESLSLKSYTIGSYLLTTTWNQGPDYNLSCPIDPTTGFRSDVGCGGVALGQLLYYWRDRVFPDGSISYTPPNFTNPVSVAFYNQNYNWQAMSPSSSDSYNAFLLYHCAAACSSEFSSNGTTSLFDMLRTALRTKFGFNVDSYPYYKQFYSTTEWLNLLKAELNAGRPVLYHGEGGNDKHVWVIDGYKADNTFHCNWGWGGIYNDTWYPLSALNTPNGNYNDGQAAMIGIYPKLGEVTGSDLVCTSNTSYSIGTPPGRVVWSKSSNLTQVGDNVSLTYIVKAASTSVSGTGTVTASILNSQNQTVFTKTKTVWVGKPAKPTNITFTPPTPCLNQWVIAQVPAINPTTSGVHYNWRNTHTYIDQDPEGSEVHFQTLSGPLPYNTYVYVKGTNTCGSSAEYSKYLAVQDCGGGGALAYAFSPNPATSNITVEQLTPEEAASRAVLTPVSTFENTLSKASEDGSYTIEIWHERKGKVKTINCNSKRQDIDISKLEKGSYFLHIITQTAIYKEHLLLQ